MSWSFMNPDYTQLPEHVRAVLDREEQPCCRQCRATPAKLLTCSRCKVAHYCSRNCQQDHFALHKRNCQWIGQLRQNLKEKRTRPHPNSELQTAIVGAQLMVLADVLVVVGYHESDTIAHGSFYYRRALDYYLELRQLIQGSFFDEDSPLEDKVLLLFVVLGGESKMMFDWCMKTGSPRFMNFMPNMEEAPPEFQTQGFASNDITFQALCLLFSMRSLGEYRQNLQAFEAYKQVMHQLTTNADRFRPLCEDELCGLIVPFLLGSQNEQGQIHMDILQDEIRLCISAIRYHGNGSYLQHLRENVPWTPRHAPNLLRGLESTVCLPTVPEFWYLYQDCFLLTPGLRDILHEFLDEREE